MFITKLDPVHIASTWRRLRAMCLRVSSIIGSIGAVATRDLAARVALLESIFRKLILVDAARAMADASDECRHSPLRHPEPVEGRRGARPFALRLKLAPPCTPSPRLGKRASRTSRCSTPAPDRLALRFEALRRAIETPQPYIQRLARLIVRRCRSNPNAAERCAIAPPRPHCVDAHDPRLIIETIALALLAAPLFVNSS